MNDEGEVLGWRCFFCRAENTHKNKTCVVCDSEWEDSIDEWQSEIAKGRTYGQEATDNA